MLSKQIIYTVLLTLSLVGIAACMAENTSESPADKAPASTIVTTRFYADTEVSGQVSAPSAMVLPYAKQAAAAIMKLPLTLRLHNNGKRLIGLSASTHCAIFRWSVVTTQSGTVESEPNYSCAQAIASDILSPTQLVEQSYLVSLDAQRYNAGKYYRLMFSFWGYPGHHDFMIKQPD